MQPKPKTKKCKHCNKLMPKGLNAYCSYQCQAAAKRKRDKQKPDYIQKKLIEKCDTTFKKMIRLRDVAKYGKICFTCKQPIIKGHVQAGHFVSCRVWATRWEPDNLRIQGSCCNKYLSGAPHEFAYYLAREIGQERVDELIEKKFTYNAKPSIPELEMLLEKFKEDLAAVEKSLE